MLITAGGLLTMSFSAVLKKAGQVRPRGGKRGLLRCININQQAHPSSLRRAQSSRGLNIPAGVMMPVISSAGVTSNPGFKALLVGLATRTYTRPI